LSDVDWRLKKECDDFYALHKREGTK
jgi:hypothetical protein